MKFTRSSDAEKAAAYLSDAAAEESCYQEAASELADGKRIEGIWIKALSENDMNEAKAEGAYIQKRAEILKAELYLEFAKGEETQKAVEKKSKVNSRAQKIIAVTAIALLILVWIPTMLVGFLGFEALDGYTYYVLDTAMYNLSCPEGWIRPAPKPTTILELMDPSFGCPGPVFHDGIFVDGGIEKWALISGLMLSCASALQASITGKLRFTLANEKPAS